jgi:Domain of unknown function (DUF6456)
MRASTSRSRRKAPRELAGPTPERWRKGDIERLPRAIADEGGHPARPYRAVDTLALMARKGTIAPEMRQAADDFHALFALAQLDPLGAPDLRRVPHELAELPFGPRRAEARKRFWAALGALGGAASPGGSCVWHVVGLQWSLKQWARHMGWNNRPLSQETASGILVGALGVLQAFYGL